MTVIKSFQCDICFKPCGPQGNITITLEQEEGTFHYHITARETGLQDIKIVRFPGAGGTGMVNANIKNGIGPILMTGDQLPWFQRHV